MSDEQPPAAAPEPQDAPSGSAGEASPDQPAAAPSQPAAAAPSQAGAAAPGQAGAAAPGQPGAQPSNAPGGSTELFRSEALDRLSVREALDSALRITSGPLWVILGACVIAVAATLVWAFAGKAPTTVSAVGVLLPPAGVVEVNSTTTGVVSNLAVEVGVQVTAGQAIATVEGPAGKPIDIDTAVSGTVDEQFVSQGSFVTVGTPIAELLPAGSPMSGVMFVSAASGKVIRVGMSATISPSTASPSQYGAIKGTVTYVSPLPVTQQNIVSLVGERQGLIGLVSNLGTPLEVVVSLQHSSSTPSGYAWTSGSGPPFAITPGTILSGSVKIATQKPISSAF